MIAIRVTDRASKVFVLGTVLVFVLIFLYGALLGTGGAFTPYHSPSPSPTPLESPSPSAADSPSLVGGVDGEAVDLLDVPAGGQGIRA